MTIQPSVLLLLDLSAVMAGTTREWQEYSRVGECYLPQVVYEEIEFLCNRAPEPNQEKIAREFMRFYPDSGWQAATADATHPSLTPPSGQALSKQARLALSTAQCAYGLSEEQRHKLVVFVSNSQPLLKRVLALGANNLSGITATALLQWCRTRQRPPGVSQVIHGMMRASDGSALPGQAQSVASNNSRSPSASVPMTGPASAASVRRSPSRSGTRGLLNAIKSVLALLGVAIACSIAWRFVQPASFNKFWNQLGLPSLPGQQPSKPKKPVKPPKKRARSQAEPWGRT